MAGGLILFTGFPGFIGTRVVRSLVRADPELRVAALVERHLPHHAVALAAHPHAEAGRVLVPAAEAVRLMRRKPVPGHPSTATLT